MLTEARRRRAATLTVHARVSHERVSLVVVGQRENLSLLYLIGRAKQLLYTVLRTKKRKHLPIAPQNRHRTRLPTGTLRALHIE